MDGSGVDVHGDHPGAFADEGMRRLASHAASRAGNHRDLTVESYHLPSPESSRGASPARASRRSTGCSDALRCEGWRRLSHAGLAVDRSLLSFLLQAAHLILGAHDDRARVVVLAPEQVVNTADDQEDGHRWSGPGAGGGEPADHVARIVRAVLRKHQYDADERHPEHGDP